MEFYGDTHGNWGRHYAESGVADILRDLKEREAFQLASQLHTELCANGGFTSRRDGVSPPDRGYMVSDGVSELRVRTCTVETIYRFLLTHWDRVKGDGYLYFGGWQTEDYVYLDVSEWFSERLGRNGAMIAALARKEIAIYDLANQTTINI